MSAGPELFPQWDRLRLHPSAKLTLEGEPYGALDLPITLGRDEAGNDYIEVRFQVLGRQARLVVNGKGAKQ